jgi:hypothetical protein
MILVMVATLEIASFGLIAGLSWAGVYEFTPRVTLVINMASVAIASGSMFLYALAFPFPAPLMGISPGGVALDNRVRRWEYSWDRVKLRGDLLEVRSSWLRYRTTYSLTLYQAARASYLRPG